MRRLLLAEADRMVGGADAWLIVDDTALPKKGEHSVGVAPQYASSLGKTANCQSLVSLTLASREVPVMVGLRLFLPESWTDDPERMARARVPENRQTALTKPEIAIEEIDRIIASGVRFGCVLAWIDADAACVLGEGHVTNPMVLVLHGPMTADGAREDFRGQHDGGRIKGGFFPPFPQSLWRRNGSMSIA